MIMDVEDGPKYVLVREGLCTEQKYLVLETENLIGRGIYATITFLSIFVSRDHCHIFKDYQSGEYYIRDLGSSNGTYVNSIKLAPGSYFKLNVGDKIGFGIDYESYLYNPYIHSEPSYMVYRFKEFWNMDDENDVVNNLCDDFSAL